MPLIRRSAPPTSPGLVVPALTAGTAGLALGVVAGLLHDQGDLLLESLFFRFALFIGAVACGRAARTASQAVVSGLALAVGAYAAVTATHLLRGAPPPYELIPLDPVAGAAHVLWVVALPLAGVLLAHLTRREGPSGDLAAAVLVQGQSFPAALALLPSGEEGCCVAVEAARPGQDWASLALAVALVVLLRPTQAGRLRTLLGGVVLTALLVGGASTTGWA
ncbi:hypothetical protein [Nonomuraea dietziae]|uniref:hypothetical protein n=1 Tax=Nonomuraea dietziae TaxID=65515 RepID=UPI0033D03B83